MKKVIAMLLALALVLSLAACGSKPAETTAPVETAPEFSSMTAVRNGAVYAFPSALEPWDYPAVSACTSWAAVRPSLYAWLLWKQKARLM